MRKTVRLKNISGEIPIKFKIALKTEYIDGRIPSIYSKNVKMGHFVLLNRKTSAYLSRIKPFYAA